MVHSPEKMYEDMHSYLQGKPPFLPPSGFLRCLLVALMAWMMQLPTQ